MSVNEQCQKVTPATSSGAMQGELASRLAQSVSSHSSYHETDHLPLVERDSLEQLRSNLKQLDEMQTRFSFMIREFQSLIK